MRKKLAVLAFLVALTGCANHERMRPQPSSFSMQMMAVETEAPPEKATMAQIQGYRELYRACLVRLERKYDDDISDAKTVAGVLRSSCPDEYQGLEAAMTQGEANHLAIREGVRQGTEALALRVVLEERATRAKR